MKISTIQIKNYRSIKDAKIALCDLTVLLGKNNEGKSNLLRAINLAIFTLQEYAHMRPRRGLIRFSNINRYTSSDEYYSWSRDYPISEMKGSKRNKKTIFVLEFVLDDKEIAEFKKNIGNQLNGSLQIKIVFEKDKDVILSVVKQGKGSKPLNEKSRRVAKYIAEHIEYNYIPAVRTVDHTMAIINEQISLRLQVERDKKDYIEALDVIAGIERKILSSLSDEIQSALREFLPDVNSVTLTSEDLGMMIRHRQDYVFKIDDGEETDLRNKGDGVKSLVAMSLLKNKKTLSNTASVIAIEEPESHLHPSAIEALRKAILVLSEKSQVVITTHNPQFVNRNDIGSNVIVENGNAVKALDIRQIRETLGVKLSDNLYGAKLLLYVEGITDRTVLNALLSLKSKSLANALKNNELVIQPMSGTDHLMTHLTTAKAMVADYYVVLDNDNAGRATVDNAQKKDSLSFNEYMLTTYTDMVKDSEMEDMLAPELYRKEIEDIYGIDLTIGEFKARNKKWAERIAVVFNRCGKTKNDYEPYINEIKLKVAELVALNPSAALRPEGETFLNRLIKELEKRI